MKKALNHTLIIFFKIYNKIFRKNKNTFFNSLRILENNFPQSKEFKFIQVGANDGVSFDNLYDLVIKRDSKGIVIEPLIEFYKQLELNYSNFKDIIKINKAVHPTSKEAYIYKVVENALNKYPIWVQGCASFDPEHLKKLNIDSNDISKLTVISDNLMNIYIQNYHFTSVDYFQIDTEGFDFEVLKMIDFKLLKPSIIKYEHTNLNKIDLKKSITLLRKNGYFIFYETEDIFACLLGKIKLY
jgi:FkbM family methyltransferase